ncbi:capsid cement protein [Nocardia sp. NPDC059228]|uniref:capsid cement protein n=1 Tax=Nocardia sp. NPDC059228 TaxID=3346777 RepID=UPI0036C9BCED
MSDFLPLYAPADKVPAVTSAAVTAGQVVVVSGNNTVAASTAAAMAYGVASQDDLVGGNQIMVWRCGIHLLTASGAIAAGDAVIPATGGAVATIGSDTNYNHVVGQALAAASGGKVLVALRLS